MIIWEDLKQVYLQSAQILISKVYLDFALLENQLLELQKDLSLRIIRFRRLLESHYELLPKEKSRYGANR